MLLRRCSGTHAVLRLGADDLWMARYILQRLCEDRDTDPFEVRCPKAARIREFVRSTRLGSPSTLSLSSSKLGLAATDLGFASSKEFLKAKMTSLRSHKLFQHGYPE